MIKLRAMYPLFLVLALSERNTVHMFTLLACGQKKKRPSLPGAAFFDQVVGVTVRLELAATAVFLLAISSPQS
ncbi:MAG: hypothetical protein IAF02_12845 [Anaerolineae bacterium]|nr:hypothetical protein [Anaerolineae bacterium]